MAEAFFNKYSKKNEAVSRGIGKYPKLASMKGVRGTVTVMKEEGIKVEPKFGKAVTRKDVENADKIVVLLSGAQLDILPKYISESRKTEYYEVVDSDDSSADFLAQHRRNRDLIKKIVLKIVKQVG